MPAWTRRGPEARRLAGRSRSAGAWWRALAWALLLALLAVWPVRAYEPQTLELGLQRSSEALYLSARLRLLPGAGVEDALLKGVPLYFVWHADVYRQRWYWTDKRVASTARTLRLAYQPLTRRWRLSLAHDAAGGTGAGLQYALHQHFDSLASALAGVGRVSRWRIADASRLEPDEKYRVEWGFRLDLALLPRPFQIGMVNQPEWVMQIARVMRVPEHIEPEARAEPEGAPPTAVPVDEPAPPAAVEVER
jgi:hypothetical protein